MNERNDRRNRPSGKNGDCSGAFAAESDVRQAEAAVRADALEEREEATRRRASDFSCPVCINASQVYDSCRDRDCVAEQRVYLTEEGQSLLEQAINVKIKSAEIIWVYTNVEPLAFQRGYFSVDMKFFVCVTLDFFCGVCNPTTVRGLTTYDKRVILYGSEGSTKRFSSADDGCCTSCAVATTMPKVTVETVEPVALTAEIHQEDGCDCCCCCDGEEETAFCGCNVLPENICNCFDGELVLSDTDKKVMVTYGLFFIVRLERETQLLVDAVDFCVPSKECPAATEESPCSLFHDIRFPTEAFFPPQKKRENDCNCCDL